MDLESLGLSKYEASCVKALLMVGEATAFQISRISGVPFGKIYEVLSKLEGKGLVSTIPGKTKRFSLNVEALNQLIEEKRKSIEKIREEIKRVIKYRQPNQGVIVETGKKNFYQLARLMPRAKKYDYSIRYTVEFRPEFVRGIEQLVKEGVDVKMLVRYSKETLPNIKKWSEIVQNIKMIKNTGVAMEIIDDKAVLIGLIRNNVTLLIRNRDFARIMRILFESYWEKAEAVKV